MANLSGGQAPPPGMANVPGVRPHRFGRDDWHAGGSPLRALGLCHGLCAVSANAAAGRGPGPIEMAAIEQNLKTSMARARATPAAA
jgi:hypothetical protein